VLGIVAVMLGLPLTGLVATAATDTVQQPAIVVAEGIEVTAPDSWEFVLRTGEAGELVVLSNGSASLAVAIDRSPNAPVESLNGYMLQMEADATQFVAHDPVPFQFGDRLGAARAGYAGAMNGIAYPIEGEVTVIPLTEGGNVLFDGWAEEGTYGAHRDAIDAIIGTARVGS
jgi:hypothetical protein